MLLLTGATGTVGSALVEELASVEVKGRALVRDPAQAERVERLGLEAVVGSFEDEGSLRSALAGVDRLFLLSPPGTAGMVRGQVAVVDAARAAGVRHVVKLSSIGADEPRSGAGIIRAHRAIERHIEASGFAFTHLRPHWFMQNELGQAETVASAGTFFAPDVGRIGTVDARDVAAVAARVLTGDGHEGRAYVLTGPETIGYGEVAAALQAVLARPVRWTEVTLEDARASMLAGGLPDELATGFTEIMARYREGGVTERVSPAVERILGRAPRSFEDFARDHRAAFSSAPATRTPAPAR